MKKYCLILLLVISSLFIIGCDNKDSTNTNSSENVVEGEESSITSEVLESNENIQLLEK